MKTAKCGVCKQRVAVYSYTDAWRWGAHLDKTNSKPCANSQKVKQLIL